MRIPWNKINQLQQDVNSLSNVSVLGGNYSRTPVGQQFNLTPDGFWAKITGVLSCSTSNNPTSLTNTAATCCTSVGDTTQPHVAYTWIEVQPDTCGRWKEGTRTGISYEANDGLVALGAVVWMRRGYADDCRFESGGSGFSNGGGMDTSQLPTFPAHCVEVMYDLVCEGGVTVKKFIKIPVISNVNCVTTSGSSGGSSGSSVSVPVS